MRAHRHPEEPRRGHHPHQRGGAGSDRLLPRQAGNGLQGIAALLDPDLHEGVDPLGGYHQEHLLPLLKAYPILFHTENKQLAKISSLTANDLETSEVPYFTSFCIKSKERL